MKKTTLKLVLPAPEIKLGCPRVNAELLAACAAEASSVGADIAAFPKLSLTGATLGDIFLQELLLSEAEAALEDFCRRTKNLSLTSFVGLPTAVYKTDAAEVLSSSALSVGDIGLSDIGLSLFEKRIYSAYVAVHGGEPMGAFLAAPDNGTAFSDPCEIKSLKLLGKEIPVLNGKVISLACGASASVVFSEDEKVQSDTDIIVFPDAKSEYIGLSDKLSLILSELSLKYSSTVMYAGAGLGESGNDGIYSARRYVFSSGARVCASKPFDERMLTAEAAIRQEKHEYSPKKKEYIPKRFPFIPNSSDDLLLGLDIQARALANRMERAYADKLVIGVSGGLDSTLAVIVARRALDVLERDPKMLVAITMPCFGTTERTKGNALLLADALSADVRTIDIKHAVNVHFKDISHNADNYDVVYENAQARERTQILMDIANAENGLVVGTGDLSELALGFATYNGDHMSMYAVNASVPKTLMRAMLKKIAEDYEAEGYTDVARVITDVIDTPVSPELLPADGKENQQHTESIVGPYELHDFFLYHAVKFGMSPSRIFALTKACFAEYSDKEISIYLDTFVRRFFSQQFKRSCLPDGPRVTEISLSPRGAWSMPSDISSASFRMDIPKN